MTGDLRCDTMCATRRPVMDVVPVVCVCTVDPLTSACSGGGGGDGDGAGEAALVAA